jgi:hypothetical protein
VLRHSSGHAFSWATVSFTVFKVPVVLTASRSLTSILIHAKPALQGVALLKRVLHTISCVFDTGVASELLGPTPNATCCLKSAEVSLIVSGIVAFDLVREDAVQEL